ncbi:MAG: UDP-N-acetylglucosamine pyrophosphorylase [Calditrichaeota bacterium]|nr:NTP transferase domain-containing protein [Calditrichota bacterium]RQW03177.1 MAG: UDP-N-acetylglucosamine pyrophosphorylase [Calditrichota bacterium]
MDLSTIILAAGKGKRMNSNKPKVLHPLLGRPMIHYVIDTALEIGSKKIILVVGHLKDQVIEAVNNKRVEFVVQEQQLGTGHAVQQASGYFKNYEGNVLVLSGDVPLLTCSTLNTMIRVQQEQEPLATLLTAKMDDPTGYGRIVRDRSGYVKKIVEHKDADPEILQIKEINVGIYIFKSQPLFETLPLVKNNNSQGEYYLPDVIKIYVEQGKKVAAIQTPSVEETHGINDLDQLKKAEEILNKRN